MGTRSLTRVFDEGDRQIVCMYRQFDGYPSGHGKELFEFLDGMVVVNGMTPGDNRKIANGAGCLAAQMVAHFKTEPGGIYLYPTNITDAGQDFEYHVKVKDGNWMNSESGGVEIKCVSYGSELFSGSVADFGPFCDKED